VIPESNYDKLKAELFKILNELNEMKNNLTKKRDVNTQIFKTTQTFKTNKLNKGYY
jgi:hypothetical protein